jgi:hypothetical protein
MCAFPLHLWALILIFRDISWVAQRTNFWDAIGVASYGLVFTFIESVIYFVAISLLGLVVSTKWLESRRVALMSILALVTALWAIDGQAYFVWGSYVPEQALRYMAAAEHPLRVLYIALLALVVPTIVIPVYFVLRSDRFLHIVRELIERLSLLTMFYLFFDLVGLIIIIIRNIF